MNATDIIGFTADADIWCQDCATRVYGAEIMTSAVEDSEGNEVRPIFADDAADFDHCCNCGAELIEHDCADHDETFPGYLESFTQHYALAMLWANTSATCDVHETRMTAFGFHCATENQGYCNFECDQSVHPHNVEVDPYAWQAPSPSWAVEAFDSDAQASIREDCDAFVRANWPDLRNLDPMQCGHDFALTRNRHGAGFWDRGLGELGDRLTAGAHAYGESDGYFTTDETEVHLS